MPDGTPDTRWQTAPDRFLNRTHDVLVDGALGVLEGGRKVRDIYNTAEDYLDEGLARVGDFFDRSPPRMTGGPMSRNGYRHHPGGYVIPANASLTPAAQEMRDYQGFVSEGHPHTAYKFPTRPLPSHLTPGYDRMVNEGYDSWSPSDGYITEDWKTRASNRWEDEMHDLGRSQDARHPQQWKESDNRSDWQKWKDSLKQGWEAK